MKKRKKLTPKQIARKINRLAKRRRAQQKAGFYF